MFKLIPLQIMLVVHVVKFVSIKMLLLSKITTHKVRWHNLSKLQLTISDGTTYPKLQLTMSDGTAYPKLQLTMSDGTTYPNYNSNCNKAQLIQITTHNVRSGTTYPKL